VTAGRLFVYGTFLPGEPRWPILEPFADAVLDAGAAGTLWDTGRGYPAAVFGGPGEIPGALVTIEPARWDELVVLLDEIEGEGALYRRVEIETSSGPATSYEWMGSTAGMNSLPQGWRHP
jgi:gamma-glutamylcyclotransferase (GGCT)/AIG2-like uncharacterized protein YtfP